MANFSKYFDAVVQSKSCSDFFHPGKTCAEAKLEIFPKLVTGSMQYFLPILLIPSLTRFEWTWEFFQKQMILSIKAVLGGCIPAIVAITVFCGFFNHLKRHHLQLIGMPVSLGVLLATLVLPTSAVNILACGAVNHLIELTLEANRNTLLYAIRGNVMVGMLAFMTLSSGIVYLYKTCSHRLFFLLHVPHKSEETEFRELAQQKPGWMDKIIRRRWKYCSHQEDSCEGFLSAELKKVTKIGLLLSTVKSLIFSFPLLRSSRIMQMPGILLKHMDLSSLFFLPAYCGSFKLINCLLNRLFKEDTTKNSIMAAFLSGSFYMVWPNFTLVSFAFIRSIQLLWLKHIEDYKGSNKAIATLKSLPMGDLTMWMATTVLFLSRFMYPHMASKYIKMCMNYLTGSLADAIITNYYGILMGLQ